MLARYKKLPQKITKENAKEFYYSNYIISANDLNFFYENFDKDILLKWNDEFINSKLDICDSYFDKIVSWETLEEHLCTLTSAINVYTINKITYKRIIDHLIKINQHYGYFINYNFVEEDYKHEFGPSIIGLFRTLYLGNKFSVDVEKESKYFDSPYHYFPNQNWCGLINTLNMLEYYELLEFTLEELLVPIFKNFNKQKCFCGCEIKYYNEELFEDRNYSLFKKYILEHNINIPLNLKLLMDN